MSWIDKRKMSGARVVIRTDADRALVADWAARVPEGTRVEFKAGKRTLEQNALMWALLTDIAQQVDWDGAKRTTGDWKIRFLDALDREIRMMSNLDGTGVIAVGRASSDLSKEQMSNLIDIIYAYGAKHGVRFADDIWPNEKNAPEEGGARSEMDEQVIY